MTELFKLIGKVAIENEEANNNIDETTGKAEKSESKITSAFKKIGTAVVTCFAVDKIVSFGKSCVEAAASVKAANSQFEQTFGDLAQSAENAIGRVADSSNILDTRLQGVGTSIYAFAKTAGMESADALGMMERALQVTADSAAYYDRSLEDTSESLKSFLKGNFENDAALGLSCTETTRNAKANELYGKSFIDLSEAQKQLTLLAMVEDANKLSGAMGQAAREGTGWENVTGNLKESWKQFQAVLGAPVLSLLVPVIQNLTTGVSTLGEKVGGFINIMSDGNARVGIFRTALESMFSPAFMATMEENISYLSSYLQLVGSNTIDMFASKLEPVRQLFSSIGVILQPLVETWLSGLVHRFDTLATIWNDVFIPYISLVIDIFTQLATTIATSITPAIQDISAKFQELQGWVTSAVQDYILPVIESFINMIRELWNENQDKINAIGELFRTVFDTIAGLVAWFVDTFKNYIYPFLGWLCEIVQSNMDNVKAVFQSIFDIIGGIVQFFTALFKGDWSGMWEAVKSILAAGRDYIVNVFNVIKTFLGTILSAIWEKVSGVFENIKVAISEKVSAAKEAVTTAFENVKTAISEKIEAAKEKVSLVFENIRAAISEKIEAAKETVFNVFETIKNVIQTAFLVIQSIIDAAFQIITLPFRFIWENCKETVIAVFEFIQQKIDSVLTAIRDFISPILESIRNTFSNIFNAVRDTIVTIFNAVNEFIQKIWNEIKNFFVSIGSAIWSVVSNAFENVRTAISNKINAAKEAVMSVFNKIKSVIEEKVNAAKEVVTSVFNKIKSVIEEKVNAAKEVATTAFNKIKSVIEEKVNAAKTTVTTVFTNIKTTIEDKVNAAKDTVTTVFSNIKSAIEEKLNAAKDTVSSIIDKIKGLFKFEWELPDLKTPHFSITPKGWKIGDLLQGIIPKLGIEWYANGGVMTKPTAFGLNGNRLMVGGEAGAEAIAPIDVLQGYVAEAVAGQNKELISVLMLILKAICALDDNMGGNLRKALEGLEFKANEREFARLVKAVR